MTRVLVVEDNAAIRELVGMYLRKAAHTVVMAESGEDALSAVASRGSPEVVVLDVEMPGMSGFELLTKLRALPSLDALPAIFLSARVTPEDIAAGTHAGASYLTKPFIGAALIRMIKDVLPKDPESGEW